MLFAHGFGCDQHMWRFVAPAFAEEYRIVLFDLVGSGGSDLTAYDPERYRSQLPPALPSIPGLEMAAAYRPAGAGDEVGGDFYDMFETDEGDWAVVLGDVCGEGAAAAAVTAREVAAVGSPGTLLGVVDDPDLSDTSLVLHPGEGLFSYTDGLTEARRGDEMFGERRLVELLAAQRGKPAADVVHATVGEILDFQQGYARDDMAAVLIGVPPAG